MTRLATFVRLPALAGISGLAIITLGSPGATRMFSTPWSLALGAACLAPVLQLLLRSLDRARPLVLPSGPWLTTVLFAGLAVLGSALASPYRGPSLFWSEPLLAGLALLLVVFDWLHASPEQSASRRRQLLLFAGFFSLAIAATSAGLWAESLRARSATEIWSARNPFPLGHSNYTAGLALLMLPIFGALAFQTRGASRVVWLFALFLPLLLLVSSGSRGGLVGLGVLVLALLPAVARGLGVRLWPIAVVALLLLATLVAFNPRTRTLIDPRTGGPDLSESTVQRSAMFTAGLALGRDRPLLGWGPGTTPLAYPRYRASLDGGVENVLQLHSTPVQLWAELGSLGLLAACAFGFLVVRAAVSNPAARFVGLSLLGYAAFSVTDWQLDVPIFTAAFAVALAMIAAPPARDFSRRRLLPGALALVTLAAIAALGHADPSPALNVRALASAQDPANASAARSLFEQSLLVNPDQEIAHFNLGWLLVVSAPPAAGRHFTAAARLVPDKGGVYFGLGLARLNQGDSAGATAAFALECINDPLFLTSPWWRSPALAPLRPAVFDRVRTQLGELDFPSGDPRTAEVAYLSALTAWVEGRARPGVMLAAANTSARVSYFARRPEPAAFEQSATRRYRRERVGYPVLMRDLDLPRPIDLFDVEENLSAATELNFLFPRKGWLPAPRLLPLLDAPTASDRQK